MDRHISYARVGFLAEELQIRSGLRVLRTARGNDPGNKGFWEEIADPSGRILRLRRVSKSNDPATTEIFNLLCRTFSEDEADTLETIQSDVTDPDVAFFVIQEKNNPRVLALINVYVLPVGPSGLQLFIGYVVTDDTERDKSLASRLYRAACLFFMRRSEIKAREAYGIVGEMVETVEEFFLKVGGCRRLYVETPERILEIPYIQPPLDFDKRTGRPLKNPVPEHLMLRLVDYGDELSVEDVLKIVWSIYESYFFEEDDFESEKAYHRHCAVMSELFENLKRSLPDPSSRVFMMNHVIRQGLARDLKNAGRKLVEVTT
ncbi:MAG: hypothetical protein WAP55_00670 [Minisyncoccia bacterium]